MEPGLIWILAGLVLLLAELALPGIFLVWVGIASIGTGLLLLLSGPGFELATAVFLGLLGGGVWLSLRLRRRTRPTVRLNHPESGLVGRHAVVLPLDGPQLRVRLGDSDWPARLPRDVRVPEAGAPVRVEGVDGNTLVVRPE